MARVRIATPNQRSSYDGIYPLHGYLVVDGVTCPVEYLGECAGDGDPKYEIMAPIGKQFDGTHSLLAENIKDLYERVGGYPLIDCPKGCDCEETRA